MRDVCEAIIILLLQVTFNKADITVSEILKVIQDAGFTAELLQKQDLQARQEVTRHLSKMTLQFMRVLQAYGSSLSTYPIK